MSHLKNCLRSQGVQRSIARRLMKMTAKLLHHKLDSLIPNWPDWDGGFDGASWNPLEERARSFCANSPSLVSIQSLTGNSNVLPLMSLTEI